MWYILLIVVDAWKNKLEECNTLTSSNHSKEIQSNPRFISPPSSQVVLVRKIVLSTK